MNHKTDFTLADVSHFYFVVYLDTNWIEATIKKSKLKNSSLLMQFKFQAKMDFITTLKTLL